MIPILKGRSNNRCQRVFSFAAAANPEEHKPLEISEWDRERYGGDVAFIGGYSEKRAEALKLLTRFALRIWGYPVWSRASSLVGFCSDEPVYGLKKTKIYNACSIIVNVEDEEKNINSLSARVPEVLACGGFVITQWSKDLDAAGFEDAVSVATFRSHSELAEKVGYYLANPEERRRVSRKGRQIVLESMTYDAAYGSILDDVQASLNQSGD
jgi:spore maturation protein CgeB